jgi:hypothetical protein
MSIVHQDAKGLYVVSGGYKARPLNRNGYTPGHRSDDGGLKKCDRVICSYDPGASLIKLNLRGGGPELHWSVDGLALNRARKMVAKVRRGVGSY